MPRITAWAAVHPYKIGDPLVRVLRSQSPAGERQNFGDIRSVHHVCPFFGFANRWSRDSESCGRFRANVFAMMIFRASADGRAVYCSPVITARVADTAMSD